MILFRNSFNFCSKNFLKLNHYEILELKPECLKQEIKLNYHRLAKIYHPDVYRGTDTNRFKMIQEAYQTLKSPEKRRKYDQEMMGQPGFNKRQVFNQEDDLEKEPDEEQEQRSNDFVKESNTFEFKDYKQKLMDPEQVQEAYDKFMNKPMKTDPGQAQVYENIFLRQQTKEYKEQSKFIYYRNHRSLYILSHGHRIGYHEQVKEYINSANEYLHKKKQETPEKIIKGQEKRNKYIKYIVFGISACLIPFVHSGLERRKKVQRWIEQDRQRMEDMEQQAQIAQTQQRLVY